MLQRRRLVNLVVNKMKTTIYRDDEETIFQSSHRQWMESQEREQQDQDEQAVERFLVGKLKQKESLTAQGLRSCEAQNFEEEETPATINAPKNSGSQEERKQRSAESQTWNAGLSILCSCETTTRRTMKFFAALGMFPDEPMERTQVPEPKLLTLDKRYARV